MANIDKIELTDIKREALEDLWFVWGNHGPKHSMPNHKFIQQILETGKDLRGFYKPSAECVTAVDSVLSE